MPDTSDTQHLRSQLALLKSAAKTAGRRLEGPHVGNNKRDDLLFFSPDTWFFRGVNLLPATSVTIQQVEVIVVIPFGRTGNNYIQLLNALECAALMGISEIITLPIAGLPHSFQVRSVSVSSRPLRDEDLVLAGTFFTIEPPPVRFTGGRTRCEGIQSLPLWALSEQPSSLSSRNLVIHLRSGDIYGRRPHPDYGQPPYGFYKKVIVGGDWSGVTLVTQDRRSPAYSAISRLCRRHRIPLQTIGRDLDETLEAFLAAEYLVVSVGTFTYPFICFSPRIRQVFWFGKPEWKRWGLETKNIMLTGFRSRFRSYERVVMRRWANTWLQLLMLRWFPRALVIEMQDLE